MQVTTLDGRQVHLEPTSSDSRLQQHHEARAKVEAKQGKVNERLRKEKIQRDSALPTPCERMEAATEGLRKIAERADRRSDPKAPELSKIVDEAVQVLHDYSTLTRQLEEKTVDPLADAIQTSARELRKVLPKSFLTVDDAALFARKLPLTKARHEATRAADARGKLSRQRNKTSFKFWTVIQRGAVKSGLAADDRILDYLADLGQL